MIYSVWKPALRRYDYYEDGQQTAAFPKAPTHLATRVASDAAGWTLPTGARKIGEGEAARGQIARGLGDFDLGGVSWPMSIGLGLLGYGLWRIMR